MENIIEHKMIVLIPFRNAREYIIECVNSVLGQMYTNYEIYLLDDCSDDGTLDKIDKRGSKIHKIIFKSRRGALGNLYSALTTLPIYDNDIVIILDGDDFIIGEYVFLMLNERYNKEKVLLTYGQYITSFGNMGHCAAYSEEEFKNLRQAPFKASHLKSFKYSLFRKFLSYDPNAYHLKDAAGMFYAVTYDMAIMMPLMEIAGFERILFVSNILYCYRLHPNNDHEKPNGRQLQLSVEREIRGKPTFKGAVLDSV